MNNKEAIGQLEWVKKRICDITYSPESFEAINLAIKALEERPKGEWLDDDNGIPICSICHNGYNTQPRCMGVPMFEFCPICGAKMKGE